MQEVPSKKYLSRKVFPIIQEQADNVPVSVIGAPWTLSAAISPRPVVRMAGIDAYGEVINAYTGHRLLSDSAPERPWAIYLAGPDRRFKLLCFDLDAKTPTGSKDTARDADVLCGLLQDAGLDTVVCESGPTGGRHVWTALIESIDAETVATLARLVKHVCPSLDLSPLSNPATGCVRPPGAPHRAGGHSTVISGSLDTLTDPTGTAEQVRSLVESIALIVEDAEPTPALELDRPLPLDAHARLYLPGTRRDLPAVSAAALTEDAASGDASAVLWRVLIGAAAARWRHADIAALVDTAPGLEHVRTYRDRGQRLPRRRVDAARVLRRQWDKAVIHVATTPRQIGDDPTFDARADAIAQHIRSLQSRADAATGRWASGGGPADRRVLDVLCVLALQALTDVVEADIRRLALLAGIGRETARVALGRLSSSGWIEQVEEASGPHAARWKIGHTPVINNPVDVARSQADPRPAGAGSAERTLILTHLSARISDARHDLFTGGPGLGHLTGNLYARTSTAPTTVLDLSTATGLSPALTLTLLDRLTAAGVLLVSARGWRRRAEDRRSHAAAARGVSGRLAARAALYALERELWAWWTAEQEWMTAPKRPGAKHRAMRGQLSLLPEPGTHAYGPHPRTADGRLDWRAARRIVEDERQSAVVQTIPAALQQIA